MAIIEYLFWLELLSLSGELTIAIHNGLKRSASEVLKHEDQLRKTEKNVDEIKEIEEVIWELRKVLDEASDYSARFAKQVLKLWMMFPLKSRNMRRL